MKTATVTASLTAAAPITYALLTDVRQFPQWLSVHAGWPDGEPGPMATGMAFRETVRLMGLTHDVEWTVMSLDPPLSIRAVARGPLGILVDIRWMIQEGIDGGSRVNVESRMGAKFPSLILAAGVREFVHALERSLENLNGIL